MNANRQHRRNRWNRRLPLLTFTYIPAARRPRHRDPAAFLLACQNARDIYTPPRRASRITVKPPPPYIPPSVAPTIFLTLSYDPLIRVTMSLMAAPQQTIEFIRGEDVVIDARFDRPQDITGWSIDFRVANQLGGPSLLTKNLFFGITTLGSTTACKGIRIALSAADTLSLSESTTLSDGYGWVWHVRRTDPGYTKVLAYGEVLVNERSTQ